MHLQIEQRESERIVILDLKGRLVLGPEDVALRQQVQELCHAGHTNVALNLKEVSELDSTALGTLIFCAAKIREAGGRLVLFNLSPSHSDLSNVMKLNTTFEIYPDQVAAVNSFFPDRAVRHYDILEFVEEREQKQPGMMSQLPRTPREKRNGQSRR